MRKKANELPYYHNLPYPENFNWYAKVQKMCYTHYNRSLLRDNNFDQVSNISGTKDQLIKCDKCGYWFFTDEL